MAIKTYKPVTNGRRNMTSLTYEEITTNKPEKSLVAKKSKNGGRKQPRCDHNSSSWWWTQTKIPYYRFQKK